MSLVECPVCQERSWFRDSVAEKIISLPEKYQIWKCRICGQQRLSPQLSHIELEEMYSAAYFSSQENFFGSLSNIYPSHSDYISQIVTTRYAKFSRTLSQFNKLNNQLKTILDVGAATGVFVKLARDLGLRADGIEFSSFAIATAQEQFGIKLEQKSLMDVSKDNYYDAIHLNHVFEHFNEPLNELGHIARLLKSKGILYIEVPYQFNLIERLLYRLRNKMYSFTIHSIHHPFFYNPHSICRLLQQNGFEILKISVFNASNYIAKTKQEKVKKLFWKILSLFKIGMNIEVFARKIA